MDDKKQLTVAELIAELERMPRDLLVFYAGSEWLHPATGVSVDSNTRHDYRATGDCVVIDQD